MAKRNIEFVLPVGPRRWILLAVAMGVPLKFTFDLEPAADGTRVTVVASRFGLLAPPGTGRSLEELGDTLLYEVSRERPSPETTDP